MDEEIDNLRIAPPKKPHVKMLFSRYHELLQIEKKYYEVISDQIDRSLECKNDECLCRMKKAIPKNSNNPA